MAGGQWYNQQTGQYEAGEGDPNLLAGPGSMGQEAANTQNYLQTKDKAATSNAVYNPATRSWTTESNYDMLKFVPEALRGKNKTWLAGLQTFGQNDPRKSGKKLVDPNAVGYDPEFGYFMHQDNYYQKKHWQDKVAKYMPSAIMALGTMGMGSAVGPLAKAGFTAGLGAMKGLSQGQKPLGVLKNAAIGAGIGYAGHLAGQALGGGFQGQLANRFVKQIPNLMNLYGGTPNLTGVSPGNVRMDQGYRPTIPTPNNYNFLRPRGR